MWLIVWDYYLIFIPVNIHLHGIPFSSHEPRSNKTRVVNNSFASEHVCRLRNFMPQTCSFNLEKISKPEKLMSSKYGMCFKMSWSNIRKIHRKIITTIRCRNVILLLSYMQRVYQPLHTGYYFDESMRKHEKTLEHEKNFIQMDNILLTLKLSFSMCHTVSWPRSYFVVISGQSIDNLW